MGMLEDSGNLETLMSQWAKCRAVGKCLDVEDLRSNPSA
jgi:hypothetical protein